MKVHNSKFAAMRKLGNLRMWLPPAAAALAAIALVNIAEASFPSSPSSEATSKTQPKAPAVISTRCEVHAFATASFYGAGTEPVSVAVGDFNGDGSPDLVTANFLSENVSVLLNLNDGSGGYGPATNFSVGSGPNSVAVSDFNGDAALDLAVSNEDPSTVSVLLNLNNGSGGFNTPVDYAVGVTPLSVAVGDFNSDGAPDLVTANDGVIPGTLSVLLNLNDGSGGFNSAVDYTVGPGPEDVAVGDFNGDGHPDLATTSQGTNNIWVLLNDGSGGFNFATQYGVLSYPQSVTVADLNGDAHPDLAYTDPALNVIWVLLNDGSRGFNSATSFPAGTAPVSLAVRDFNEDGKLDLATANQSPTNTVSVLLGDGLGAFGTPTSFPVGPGPFSVAAGDFNSDGRPDLATADQYSKGDVAVLLNECGSLPTVTPTVTLTLTPTMTRTATSTSTNTLTPTNTPTAAILCVDDSGGSTGAPCANPTAYTSIQAAVNASNASDEIRIATGTYTGTTYDKALSVSGGYSGGPSGWAVPNAGNVATLGGTQNILSSANVTERNFLTLAGDLNALGLLRVDGTLNWVSGSMVHGGCLVSTGGVLNISGGRKDLISGVIRSQGIVNWASGGFYLQNAAIFNNSGGAFNIQNNQQCICPNGGVANFYNDGTLRKTAGLGRARLAIPFNHTGTASVLIGTLQIDGGGTGSVGGSFDTAPGAVTEFSNSYTMTSPIFTGGGVSRVTGGILTLNGTMSTSNFELAAGTLAGTNYISGTLNWTGGTINGAVTAILGGSTLNISGGRKDLINSNLTNLGTINWSSGGLYLYLQDAYIRNSYGAIFNIQNDGCICHNGSTYTLYNDGTLRKVAGSGHSQVSVPFNNTSLIQVLTGTLDISGGGTTSGTYLSIYNVASGAGLRFTNSYTLNSPNFTGAGIASATNGTLTVNGTMSTDNFELAGANLAGTNYISGTLNWTGGGMNGAGTTILAGSTLNMAGARKDVMNGNLTNQGTINWTSASAVYLQNAYIRNSSSGTLNIQNDVCICPNGGTTNVYNEGILHKVAGALITGIQVPFSNGGTIDAQTGTLRFASTFTQTGGSTRLNGGNISSASTFTFQGGILTGGGTISGNVSNVGAQVKPGFSPGILTIIGNYSQGSGGSLNLEIGGYTPGTQYDRLDVSGLATLDGTLNASLINDFTPNTGDSFQVMNYGSRSGLFATVVGTFATIYNPTNLTLVAGLINSPTPTATGTATRTSTRTSTPTRTGTPTRTPTGTATPCTACALQVTSVQIACNTDGTIHWSATVFNSAACEILGSYGAFLLVQPTGTPPPNPLLVQSQFGFRILAPGQTVVQGDFCYSTTLPMHVIFTVSSNSNACFTYKISTTMPACQVQPTCALAFSDVQPSNKFYNEIMSLSALKVVAGYEDGTFKPGPSMARGSAVKILVQAFNLPIDASSTRHFSDVPQDSPYLPYIEAAYKQGLVNGYKDGTFRQEQSITRGALVKMVVQAAGWELVKPEKPTFTDVRPDAPLYPYVETASAHSLLNDVAAPSGLFQEDKEATRGESVALVARGSATDDLQRAKEAEAMLKKLLDGQTRR